MTRAFRETSPVKPLKLQENDISDINDVSFPTLMLCDLDPTALYRLGQYLREATRDQTNRDACLDWVADTDAYALWQGLGLVSDESARRREPLPRDEGVTITHLTDRSYDA